MREIIKLLKKSNKIAIFSHRSPDPDAVGSALALKFALNKLGKTVSLFCEDNPPENYYFLNGVEDYNKDKLEGFDLYISVDVASPQLLGTLEEQFTSFYNTAKIDHHSSGTVFAKQELVRIESACAIIIFELIQKMKIKFDEQIATYLYFAICGDTGVFRNNNLNSKVFAVCSKLLEYGADYKRVYVEFFEKRTLESLYLTSGAILNAKVDEENKIVVMSVPKSEYEKYGADPSEHIGNLPNTFLNCGYKISVILKQKDDMIRCSLRSKSEFDVSKIAEKFGGGGHKNASGCSFDCSIKEAEMQIEKAMIDYLKEYYTNES